MNTLYLKRTIANKCPRCGEGNVLDGVFVRRDTCPVCELKYDRGEWMMVFCLGGGVPVSYSFITALQKMYPLDPAHHHLLLVF